VLRHNEAPQVYTALYGWDEYQTGLVQVSLVIGEINQLSRLSLPEQALLQQGKIS
jgi:hypothetical protein